MASITRAIIRDRRHTPPKETVVWLFLHNRVDIVLTDSEVDSLLDSIEQQRAAATAQEQEKS